MYNLTTNRELMSPSERIQNVEANCESINDHIDSIGKFGKIFQCVSKGPKLGEI